MLVVMVSVEVKPEYIEEFKKATLENARKSLQEPGIARFDVLQQQDNPTRFLLVEAYRSQEATAAHKDTVHYAVWRQTVEKMMAQPRKSLKYDAVFPEESGW